MKVGEAEDNTHAGDQKLKNKIYRN